MLKIYSILAVGLLMNTASLCAYAQEPLPPGPTLYSGGFVTGLGITTLESIGTFGGNTGAVLEFGYYDPCWMFDIGLHSGTDSRAHSFVTFILGHLGPRNRLYENLFISYGVMGLGNFATKTRGKWNAWSLGAFAGLDYQFSKHFLLSGKIYPYNYEHGRARFTNSIFANGTLSLFYVF